MMILRREAQRDIRTVHDGYERQRPGLGKAFVLAVDAVLERIDAHPQSSTAVYRQVRRALCRRFPYAVFYLTHGDRVIVIAVLHQRRHPAAWQART